MKRNITFSLFLLLVAAVACTKNDGGTSEVIVNGDATGRGGSMARFAVVGDYLYTVDRSNLNVFNISDANNPEVEKDVSIGWEIETIFPTDTLLYIGSQSGMFIYSIDDPMNPKRISEYQHVTSCDPVVVRDNYAFVTLSTESWCGNNTNELQVVDLNDIYNPKFIKGYNMQNPKGLATKDSLLFVCDKGLKVFDASNVWDIRQLDYFNIEAMDVIALDEVILVIGSDGLYQYSYTHGNELELLSHIKVEK